MMNDDVNMRCSAVVIRKRKEGKEKKRRKK